VDLNYKERKCLVRESIIGRGRMSVERNRVLIKGLLLGCPFEVPLHDCPLSHLRMLPKQERIAIADSMEPHEIEEYLLNHGNCLMERRKTRTPTIRPAPTFAGEQRI
jgi:hypothetical protein